MIRTGEQFRDSLRDGREVWMNGERIKDVTRHPAFKPLVDIRARIYDMQHEASASPLASACPSRRRTGTTSAAPSIR